MLLLSLALAAEIQVTAARPVVVAIDGRPAGVAGTMIDTRDLSPGTHRVQVRNFVGSLLAEVTVDLGDGERLRLSYDRTAHSLDEMDRVPLECHPTPEGICGMPSSLVVTGLSDISGLARAQNEVLPFDSDVQGFLATDLLAPLIELHLRDNDQLRFHGAVPLVPGRNTTCHLLYKSTAWLVDCKADGPAQVRAAASLPLADL